MLKLDQAILGGIPGTGYVEMTQTGGALRESLGTLASGYVVFIPTGKALKESRGVFAYSQDYEHRVRDLFASGQPVEFEGPVIQFSGRTSRTKLKVLMTGLRTM